MEPVEKKRSVEGLYNLQAMKEFDVGNVNFDFDLGFGEKEAETLQRDIERMEADERIKR
jgi:hypothetical protein